jgi:hypothetical protein
VVIGAVSLTWTTGNEVVLLAPLALPIAIFLAWRWGERAIVPVVAGMLPFVLSIRGLGTVATPGGIWPLLAILFWCRFARDEAFRGQLLRRERLSWTEVALIVLPLSCGTGISIGKIMGLDAVLLFDPDWMIATVAIVVGASRMPKERLVEGFIVAGLIHQASGLFFAYAGPEAIAGTAGHLGLRPAEVFLALVGLYIVPACRGPLSPDILSKRMAQLTAEKFAALRPRYPSEETSITIQYAGPTQRLFDPDRLILGFLFGLATAIWLVEARISILSNLGDYLGLSGSSTKILFSMGILDAVIVFAWGFAVASSERLWLTAAFWNGMVSAYAIIIIAVFAFPKFVGTVVSRFGGEAFAAVALGDPEKGIAIGTLGICAAGFFLFGRLLPIAIKEGSRDFSFRSALALMPIYKTITTKRAANIESGPGEPVNSVTASGSEGAGLYRDEFNQRRKRM